MSHRDEHQNMLDAIEAIRAFGFAKVQAFTLAEGAEFMDSLNDILHDTLEAAASRYYRQNIEALDQAEADAVRRSDAQDYREATHG